MNRLEQVVSEGGPFDGETMQEKEQSKQRKIGKKAAYENIMLQCAAHLGVNDPLTKAAALISERRDAIAALRSLCDHLGLENDWPDSLYLADIIEKHIEQQLEEAETDQRNTAWEESESQ